jgi:amino acid adenylation domain-containing protein
MEKITVKPFNYNGAIVNPELTTTHFLFEQQVKSTPNKIAVIYGDKAMTFKELNARGNQVANKLLGKGIEKETIIGLFVDRGIEAIIAMLGAWKAGGAFFLIDKNCPIERIKYILNNSQLHFALVDKNTDGFADILGDKVNKVNIVSMESCHLFSSENPEIPVTGNNLAYVIYTSGTTGIPKGVLIEHKGLVNTLLNQIELLNIASEDHALTASSFCFDASIAEIGVALLSGATLYIATQQERTSIKKLSSLLLRNKITVATFTPSVLRLIPNNNLRNLRIIISAGEPCTPDLLRKIDDRCYFYNAYGPTEVSICATMAYCKKNSTNISIGYPLKNVIAYALKDNFMPITYNELGTLYIGGIGLARGYLNNIKLTNKKFIKNVLNPTEHLYNTGDLVRMNEDGLLNYVGRKDDEVKVCGNRVNLNEIKCLLSQHPCINTSLVKLFNSKKNKNKIMAIIETEDNELNFRDIRKYLLNFIPHYMLPSKIIKTKKIPLSMSGKIESNLSSYLT